MPVFSPPSLRAGTAWRDMRVGLLGGSFNPAHDGHLHITEEAIKRLGLHAVWWMVSPQNPLKSEKGMAPHGERLKSARAVSRHNPAIVVTDIETALGTRYTADTLQQLAAHFPQTRFVWLMGADNLRQIHLWDEWERIFAAVPVAVLNRPPVRTALAGAKAAKRFESDRLPESASQRLADMQPPAWTVLRIPLNPISATQIRTQKGKTG